MVDASDYGIGAVLQQLERGVWKPLSFFSRKLIDAQKRHSTYDRELLACQHVPGKDNIIADALSRIDELHLQPAIDYEGIAKAQEMEEELKEILSSHNFSLKLEKFPIFGSNFDIFCDFSAKKRTYIPEAFWRIAFNNIHNLAHPGIRATTKLLTSKFLWPSINKDARTWARSCIKCQKSKVTWHARVQSSFQQYHSVTNRFTEINLDIIGPLPSSEGFRFCLTIIDRYSRWMEAFSMPDFRADNILKGFKRYKTTTYHPQTNCCIERWYRILKASIKCHENESWTISLPIILLGLSTIWRADFEATPAELFYGESIRLPFDFFEDALKQKPFIFKDPKDCSHVFVRTDSVRQSLKPPHHGPAATLQLNITTPKLN
ncbi:retrotransposable element Tf2 155 kDa protein type 1 [Trichonephila clavipes]|nr:retrotransposable element Tf2 155 kDa protein type 1 [Trichonephila clavipes]